MYIHTVKTLFRYIRYNLFKDISILRPRSNAEMFIKQQASVFYIRQEYAYSNDFSFFKNILFKVKVYIIFYHTKAKCVELILYV